jgi:hypothetical protein
VGDCLFADFLNNAKGCFFISQNSARIEDLL